MRCSGHGSATRARLVSGLSLAAVAMALAASPGTAAAGDMTYVASDLVKLSSRMTASATAKCPADTFVVGGGVSIKGSNTATGMHSSYPVQLGPHRGGWRVVVNSRSAADKMIIATATCAKSGRYEYEQGSLQPVSNGTFDYEQVSCDAGQPVVGGGVKLSGRSTVFSVVTTRPFDSDADPDKVPDDGWRGAGANSSGATQYLRPYAICERSKATHTYKDNSGSIPTGGQGYVAAGCPSGTEATAGGGTTSSTSLATELADSYSYDGGDRDRARDDGWQQVVNNESGGEITLYTYAVCRG